MIQKLPLFQRLTFAAIALAALAGILIHLQAQYIASGSVIGSLWTLARYFTVTTNALVFLVFGALAAGFQIRFRIFSGVVLAITLVGVVYALLLQGLVELTAGSAIANVLLHRITPVASLVAWLMVRPRGQLRWSDPVLWAIYPVLYLIYALVRGAGDGLYAYPFIDIGTLGASRVAINAVAIGAGFLVAGWILVWLDHMLARSAGNR